MAPLTLLLLAALGLEAEPTLHEVRDAIQHLAPQHVPARRYARIVKGEAARRRVHPLLVVAFIHKETGGSWNPRLVSPTKDFGLTQVHVAAPGSERFLGREHELFDPRTNIREWVRLADMWRAYHNRSCGAAAHLWWNHLKWGYKVKEPRMGVLQIYQQLCLRRLLRYLQPLRSSSQIS